MTISDSFRVCVRACLRASLGSHKMVGLHGVRHGRMKVKGFSREPMWRQRRRWCWMQQLIESSTLPTSEGVSTERRRRGGDVVDGGMFVSYHIGSHHRQVFVLAVGSSAPGCGADSECQGMLWPGTRHSCRWASCKSWWAGGLWRELEATRAVIHGADELVQRARKNGASFDNPATLAAVFHPSYRRHHPTAAMPSSAPLYTPTRQRRKTASSSLTRTAAPGVAMYTTWAGSSVPKLD